MWWKRKHLRGHCIRPRMIFTRGLTRYFMYVWIDPESVWIWTWIDIVYFSIQINFMLFIFYHNVSVNVFCSLLQASVAIGISNSDVSDRLCVSFLIHLMSPYKFLERVWPTYPPTYVLNVWFSRRIHVSKLT